jgi:hypothetical protein
MASEHSPRCECYFNPETHGWTVRYFNCDDEKAERRADAYRIEEITKQLSSRSGLTNRERRELDRERDFLKRHRGESALLTPSLSSEKQARKMKAAEKKLEWFTRKKMREGL